jgi:acyl-CoA synthetase (AMP-forming)/AMP-acid ligase II
VLSLAGAAIFPQEILASRATLTPNTYIDYGANETGSLACLCPEDPVGGPGRVGKPNPQVEAQVVDEADCPLPMGTVGKLRFRTPWMCQGYAGNEQATARSFREGWFYPNDYGLLEADGFLVLRGRTDDIINYGGVKIDPHDVELVLMQHPHIQDAAVVGLPDGMAGQVPVGFLVARGNIELQALRAFCAERMEGRQIPVRWVPLRQIPRNPEGKILRDQLRAAYPSSGTRSEG